MRNLAVRFLFAFAITCALAFPFQAQAQNFSLKPAVRFQFLNCEAGGSASQQVTAGRYAVRILQEDVFICYAATCAAGGEPFPSGTTMLLTVEAESSSVRYQTVSCRSSAATGDLYFTRG